MTRDSKGSCTPWTAIQANWRCTKVRLFRLIQALPDGIIQLSWRSLHQWFAPFCLLHVKLGNTTITFFTFSFHLAVNGDDFVTKFEVFALIARITEMYSIALFPKLWNPVWNHLLVSIKWLLIAYVSTQHQHETNQLLHHCQPCDSLVRNNQHELGVNKWWGSVLNNMDLYNTESRGLFT